MGGFAEYELVEGDDGGTALVLSGPYLVSTIGAIDQDLRGLDGPLDRIDLSAITEIDTVGAWMARWLANAHEAEITGASDRAKRLIGALTDAPAAEDLSAPRLPVWERVPQAMGDKVYGARRGVYGVLGFLGALLVSSASLVRHPRRFRVLALVRQLELVGVTASRSRARCSWRSSAPRR